MLLIVVDGGSKRYLADPIQFRDSSDGVETEHRSASRMRLRFDLLPKSADLQNMDIKKYSKMIGKEVSFTFLCGYIAMSRDDRN
jgi:hypothetical protein